MPIKLEYNYTMNKRMHKNYNQSARFNQQFGICEDKNSKAKANTLCQQ